MYYTFVGELVGGHWEERQEKAPNHFKKYDDPGHGWFAVKKSFLKSLFRREVAISQLISSCSYEKGETVYLEEDCDGSLFIDTLIALKIPFTIEYKHTNKSSPIRSYSNYQG